MPSFRYFCKIKYGLPWLTIFLSVFRRFASDFREWCTREWKIYGQSLCEWPSNLIHTKPHIMLFITRYYDILRSEWANRMNDKRELLLTSLSPVLTRYYDVTWTRSIGIVTPRSPIVLGRTNRCKFEIHWYISIVNIDLLPTSIQSVKSNDKECPQHYNDVIMSAMASEITSLTIVCSIVCSGADRRKYQSSASLTFVRGIHRWIPRTKGQ